MWVVLYFKRFRDGRFSFMGQSLFIRAILGRRVVDLIPGMSSMVIILNELKVNVIVCQKIRIVVLITIHFHEGQSD